MSRTASRISYPRSYLAIVALASASCLNLIIWAEFIEQCAFEPLASHLRVEPRSQAQIRGYDVAVPSNMRMHRAINSTCLDAFLAGKVDSLSIVCSSKVWVCSPCRSSSCWSTAIIYKCSEMSTTELEPVSQHSIRHLVCLIDLSTENSYRESSILVDFKLWWRCHSPRQ